MINESGTMTGGGGKPRGGRMCIGSQAPKSVDARAAAQELQAAEQELSGSQEVLKEARGRLSDAAADAKNAERMLTDLETAIPKVGGVGGRWLAAFSAPLHLAGSIWACQ
jgi:structural maintenance of chromosome 4